METGLPKPVGRTGGWKTWTTKKKLLVVGGGLLAIIALAIALGVGLGLGLNKGEGEGEEETPPPTSNGTTEAKWKPAVGTTWQIELLYPLNDTSYDVDVYDIDLASNSESTISRLHSQGRRVICYFSAGSWENWRDDKDEFKESDLGEVLDGWPNERWLNVRSSNVRRIMQERLDLAQQKGCDGVDPDNVDGYDNSNGLDLTRNDAIDYVNWLANETHARNMSIGLKNAGDIIPSVIGNMQWSVNEQCAQYSECDTYAVFTEVGKPVFHIEYPKGDERNDDNNVTASQKEEACSFEGSGNFSTLIKNMNLDNWLETC